MGEENNGKMYVKFEGEEWQEFVGVQEVPAPKDDNNPRFEFNFPMFEKALKFSCNSWSVFGTILIDEIVKNAPNKRVAHLIRHGKRLTKKKNIKRAMRNNYQHSDNKMLKNVKKEKSNESSND